MALCKGKEREIAEAIGKLDFTNPFIPERIALEKTALGSEYCPPTNKGNIEAEKKRVRFNTNKLKEHAIGLLAEFRKRLLDKELKLADGDLRIYESLVIYYLYELYRSDIKAYFIDKNGKYSLADCYTRFFSRLEILSTIAGTSF